MSYPAKTTRTTSSLLYIPTTIIDEPQPLVSSEMKSQLTGERQPLMLGATLCQQSYRKISVRHLRLMDSLACLTTSPEDLASVLVVGITYQHTVIGS